MRYVLKSIGAFAVLAMMAGGISQVAAHHSASMFDFTKSQTLKGKVVEMRWVNPHVTITITGTTNPDEAPGDWLIETTSPGNLVRAGGWRRDALKPGDEVEVTFHPEREAGKKSGLLQEVKQVSTGEVFTANIRDQEKPGLE
ncbi:MAG: DUF6152 family protein [Bradyrhizobium sp.]